MSQIHLSAEKKKSNAWGTKSKVISKRVSPTTFKEAKGQNVWLKTPNSDAKRKFCILGPPLPSQRGLSFLPSKFILPPTQGSRPSGKFQQECKLRDVYKTEINFIKWPPVWSPGRHSTQTFPLWAKECCLHSPLRMGCWDQESSFQVYSSRSAL